MNHQHSIDEDEWDEDEDDGDDWDDERIDWCDECGRAMREFDLIEGLCPLRRTSRVKP